MSNTVGTDSCSLELNSTIANGLTGAAAEGTELGPSASPENISTNQDEEVALPNPSLKGWRLQTLNIACEALAVAYWTY